MIYGEKFLNTKNPLELLEATIEHDIMTLNESDFIVTESFSDVINKIKEKISLILSKIAQFIKKIFPGIEKWLNGIVDKLMNFEKYNIKFDGEKTITLYEINDKYNERHDMLEDYDNYLDEYKKLCWIDYKNDDNHKRKLDDLTDKISKLRNKLVEIRGTKIDNYFTTSEEKISSPADYKKIAKDLIHLKDLSNNKIRDLKQLENALKIQSDILTKMEKAKSSRNNSPQDNYDKITFEQHYLSYLSSYTTEIGQSIKIIAAYNKHIIQTLNQIANSDKWSDPNGSVSGVTIKQFGDPEL